MHVLALPNEILQLALSFLLKPSLLNTSLVCKRFCSTAQPLLFRSIKLWLMPLGKPISLKHYGTMVDYDNLLRSFSNRSALRVNVQSLSLVAYDTSQFHHFGVNPNHLIRLLPCLRNLHLATPPAILDVSENPVLRTIDLDFGGFNDDPYDSSGRKRNQPVLGSLSQLLSKRSLQTLEACCFQLSDPDKSFYFPRYRYRTSRITSLSLQIRERGSVGALPELLNTINALQTLVLDNECSGRAGNIAAPRLSAHSIRESISHHHASLIHLVIACSNAATFLPNNLFGPLNNFPCLQRLGIPECFLASTEDLLFDYLLPRSLKLLQIQYSTGFVRRGDTHRHMRIERLVNLLRAIDSELPNLKHVIWWHQQPQEERFAKSYGPFIDIFELGISFWCKDVRFQYIKALFYEDTVLAGKEYPPGVNTADFKGWLSPEDLCVMEEEFDDGKWLDQHLGI